MIGDTSHRSHPLHVGRHLPPQRSDTITQATNHPTALWAQVSFHKYGDNFFPGTGAQGDVGHAGGHGYSVNVPLKEGMDDESYKFMYEPIMKKVMAVRPTPSRRCQANCYPMHHRSGVDDPDIRAALVRTFGSRAVPHTPTGWCLCVFAPLVSFVMTPCATHMYPCPSSMPRATVGTRLPRRPACCERASPVYSPSRLRQGQPGRGTRPPELGCTLHQNEHESLLSLVLASLAPRLRSAPTQEQPTIAHDTSGRYMYHAVTGAPFPRRANASTPDCVVNLP